MDRRDSHGPFEGAGRRIAADGASAVNAVERLICGADAVDAPEVAEGLALAGRRAATLLAGRVAGNGYVPAPLDGPGGAAWVHHRIGPANAACPDGFAFELVAADARQALEHCLVAHRVARRTGRPVVCTIARDTATSLHRLRLPTREMLAAIDAPFPPATGPEGILEEARARIAAAAPSPGEGAQTRPVVAEPRASLRLGVVPGGSWADGLLLRTVARPELESVRLWRPELPGLAAIGIGPEGSAAPETGCVNLLLAVGYRALERPHVLDALAQGGTLVVHAAADRAESLWARLTDESRRKILDRRCRLLWIDPATLPPEIAGGGLDALQAALLDANIWSGLCGSAAHSLGDGLPRGSLRELDPSRLESTRQEVPPDADDVEALPRMPRHQVADEGEDWVDLVRAFHLSGAGAADVVPPLPLRPAALERCLVAELPLPYPFVADAGDEVGIELGPQTLLRLYVSAVRAERGQAAQEHAAEQRRLAQRMAALLEQDDARGPQGIAPGSLAARLGAVGGEMFDPQALAAHLPRRRGALGMAPARRERIERAAEILRRRGQDAPREPQIVVVSSIDLTTQAEAAGARFVRHARPVEAALGLYLGLARESVACLRAMRVARLEAQGAYEEDRHDAALERMDWQSLTRAEQALVPQVVVLEPGRRGAGASVGSLSRLLRSTVPVHALVCETDPGLDPDPLGEAPEGQVALGRREAFVVQTTLARPAHLFAGLRGLARSRRSGAAFVAEPAWDSAVAPQVQLAASLRSRKTPCFRYDPDAGDSWADCFELSDNPQIERVWPQHEWAWLDEDGARRAEPQAFTPAHAAAANPAYRTHLRTIPPEAWSPDQCEIAEWLDSDDERQRDSVPYVWVEDETGTLARAVITRELAFACRERMRAWCALQELSRVAGPRGSADVAPEAQPAPDATQSAPEAANLEQIRGQAMHEALERLIGVLVDPAAPLDLAGSVAAAIAEPVPAESLTVPSPATGGAATPPDARPAVASAPAAAAASIDSFLCTSCQDCININSRMFRYNGDKQAYIADATAGTFSELVKAAEKCPARCIHPGTARPGDKSATPQMIARAAKFD